MEAIAFDAVSDDGWGAGSRTEFDFNHTPVGAPTLIVVTIHSGTALGAIINATYGGAAMTHKGVANGPTGFVNMWTLLSPDAGVKEVDIDFTNDIRCGCICRSYVGEIGKLGTFVGDGDTEPDGGGAVHLTVSGVMGGLIVDGITVMDDLVITEDPTATYRFHNHFGATGQNTGGVSDMPSASILVDDWSGIVAGSNWGLCALSVNPPPRGIRWFF